MVYFIADCHFGHKAVIRMTNRPFVNVDEMNSFIINGWRRKVRNIDKIYIVGDMFYKHEEPEVILKQLTGKMVLVKGNHDDSWLKQEHNKYFEDIVSMDEINTGSCMVTICHYPMMTWHHSTKSYMVHGHIHNNVNSDFWNYLKGNNRILNAGVDINGFVPVSLDELIKNNNRFKLLH